MSYKTILVQVDESRNVESRIELAASIAVAENAHLIGMALTGVSKFLHRTLSVAHDDPNLEIQLRKLRRRAQATLEKFDEVARRRSIASSETRLVNDEYASGISIQARCADLVVLGQPDPDDESSSPVIRGFPEQVLIHSGVPGLVVPYVSTSGQLGDNALVAWNASMEATRSVHYAIPLLKRAKTVKVAIFNPQAHPDLYGDPPGTDIARLLARHEINVDVVTATADGAVGEALLSLAGTLASDYLVMGCYGHSRFREILLGGVTASVLASTPFPVLMAH